jgi:Ca-activated chloride channel family protein
MLNPHSCENSRPDGFSVLEIESGDEKSPRAFVPLRNTELHGEITGPLAALRLVQTFALSNAEGDKVVEALYRFPLPGDAAVTSVRVRFGEVCIRTDLKERAEAETDYADAKAKGKQAALVTRETPDVFTLRIAGITPGQDVRIETSYLQLARAEGSRFSLRIPLTTSPRYVREDEENTRHAQGQPLALLRDPGHRFSLDLVVHDAASVSSSTHRLEVTPEPHSTRVRLVAGQVVPDRDCVLAWQPTMAPDRPALQAWLHDDQASGLNYFLTLVSPPATHDPGRGLPREIILLVDHSGSMQGAKWQAADWAVERFLSSLSERDSFALGLFHTQTRWLNRKPQAATQANVAKAVDFLRVHTDSGGTELGVALEQALGMPRNDGECGRHVLVITDAEVTDAGRLFRLADDEAQRPDRRRVSVLCIDAAPNAMLASDLALHGGGVARFLTSAPDEGDIATALDEVLADWSEPVLAGLRLCVNRPRVCAAARRVDVEKEPGWSAIDLGDLPAGRALWVVGRAPRGDSKLSFRVRTGRGVEVAASSKGERESAERPALKALFGAGRIRALEYLIHAHHGKKELRERLLWLGYDEEVFTAGSGGKVYAENAAADATAGLKKLLVTESLHFGLASMETAFVAIREEPGKPVEETRIVANALPAGWSEQFAGSQMLFCSLRWAPPSAGAGGKSVRSAPALGRSRASAPARKMKQSGAGGARVAKLMDTEAEPGTTSIKLFDGIPSFTDSCAVLFDSSEREKDLPKHVTFVRLRVRFPDGKPLAGHLEATLQIYVDDLSTPRAHVKLADLIRQRGERPLSIRRQGQQLVRVVLADASGAWASGGGLRLEIVLELDG